ncbi:cytochrome P450 78A5-like [Phragmites australis]|uniref:cytochrome P450 78A5-like n=1 Tax=Phragmites australis TaxID=29695 RepID=UPI002D79453B|nr:cytochrome P450 78A5-like [Phragmites australis]
MRTELVTTMISCVFIMHFTTINSSVQPPWLLSLLSLSLAMSFVVANRHALARRNGAAAAAIPGPRGWPLLGSLPAVSGPLMHRRLTALADAHGARRLMSLTLGATPVVISSHPDTAREILSGPAFVDRPPKAAARELMFCRAIGFAPAGEYWRRLRRVAGAGMLSPRRIAALEGLRRHIADGMAMNIRSEMERSGEVAMRAVLQSASLQSMAGSVLGLEGGASEQLAEMVREGYELVGTFNLGDHYYTSLWGPLMDLWGVGPRCRRLAARVREYFGKIIEERRVAGDCQKRDDLLSYMLALPKEERLEDSDAIAVLWEMIFRGVDVVAILVEWALARIALHPDIQSKAHKELDAVVGPRPVTDSDVPNLRFLQSVVKETLRMHPPGPLLSWARLAVRGAHVGKHLVPAGTTAMVNMWAIAHDEAIWGDPWVFRPERFAEEEDVSVLGSDLRLAPFGSGRRICPGRMMGLSTVHLWLGRLLQEYEWSPAQPIKLAERLRLSMEMKKPLVCRAVRRGEAASDHAK